MKKFTLIFMSMFTLGAVTLTSCSKKEGCTDPVATNFDADAQKDDGSCIYEDTDVHVDDHSTSSHVTINFNHNFAGLPVNKSLFNQFNYVNANNDTLSINKLRYLISDIKLYLYNGDSIQMGSYRLIDLETPTTASYYVGHVTKGSYAAIGFNFGFDSLDNMGNYTDLNAANWNWPSMIGGGYHNMQFEGKFMANGVATNYAYHNGTASNMGNYNQNHIHVILGGVSLNQEYCTININMDLSQWFENPIIWDLNVLNSMLMPNYTAQLMMHANGYNVFSLGNTVQKQ
ncbi:MAG: hypothetical protein KDD41_12900 [Flavobacteriales bacterium]|nr:hypothetical protein [Flavobacteriales bacterium]